MLYRRMFVRAGAGLDGAGKARMAAIRERLAVLSTAFSQNLLADERDWVLALAAGDLAGLPDFLVQRSGGGGGRTRAGRPCADAGPVADRAVPAILAAPRVARGRLARLGGARCRRWGDRQPRHCRRDPRPAARTRGPSRLCQFRRLQTRARDGRHSGRGARPSDAGLAAGAGGGRGRCAGAGRDDAR